MPAVAEPAPSPQYAAAAERARALVRAAALEQNLPGVSVVVGAGLAAKEGGAIVHGELVGGRVMWLTCSLGDVSCAGPVAGR